MKLTIKQLKGLIRETIKESLEGDGSSDWQPNISDEEIEMAIEDAVEYARFHMTTKESVFDKLLLPVVRDNPEREKEVRARFYQKLRSEF